MAFIKSNFLDFLGLFTQPQDLHSPVDTFQGPQTSPWAHEVAAKPLQSGQGKSGGD